MKVAFLAFGMILSTVAGVWAGPNAGGTLILHDHNAVAYSSDGVDFQSALVECGSAEAQIPPAATFPPPDGEKRIWYAYAAFPPGRSPRLKLVEFGIDYQELYSNIGVRVLWTQAPLGAMVQPTSEPAWPAPRSGVTLIFAQPLTAEVDPVLAFAGYGSGGQIFLLTQHPDPLFSNSFGDDSTPPVLDRVERYGSIGFGTPGTFICPAPARGACCSPDGSCRVSSPLDCSRSGDVYEGDFVGCRSNLCPRPPGACCLPDGRCQLADEEVCLSYEYQGIFFGSEATCEPVTCPQPPPPSLGACCTEVGECTQVVRWACSGGLWLIGSSCSPNPCPNDPGPGACCDRRTGTCALAYGRDCLVGGAPSLWLGAGTDCDPNPCPAAEAVGACCFLGGECRLEVAGECPSGDWHADLVCTSVPCTVPAEYGACCLEDYRCEILRQASCPTGDWRVGEPCSISPCAPIFGACCLSTGECVYSQESACLSGDWRIDAFCVPGLCPVLPGACCDYPALTCLVLTEAECRARSETSIWREGETCEPNPCLIYQDHGACCVADECFFLSESECGEVQGTFQAATPCQPRPCPEPLIDFLTWGKIKSRFRE